MQHHSPHPGTVHDPPHAMWLGNNRGAAPKRTRRIPMPEYPAHNITPDVLASAMRDVDRGETVHLVDHDGRTIYALISGGLMEAVHDAVDAGTASERLRSDPGGPHGT